MTISDKEPLHSWHQCRHCVYLGRWINAQGVECDLYCHPRYDDPERSNSLCIEPEEGSYRCWDLTTFTQDNEIHPDYVDEIRLRMSCWAAKQFQLRLDAEK